MNYSISLFFDIVVTMKYPDQKQLREEKVCLGLKFQRTTESTMMEKAW